MDKEIKCKDFHINAENSDAECFVNDFNKSKEVVRENPSICDICVYNEKHSHMNWEEWQEYRKEIGIEPKH